MSGRLGRRTIGAALLVAAVATFGVIEHRATTTSSPTGTTLPFAPSSDPHVVAVVGDSLSVQAGVAENAQLRQAGWPTVLFDAQLGRRIEAQPSALPTSGIAAVRSVRAGGTDPLTWVVELGTNDVAWTTDAATMQRMIDTMVDEIGPGHRIVWVNVHHGEHPGASAMFNRLLDRTASHHASMVIADWAARAATGGYLASDGIHLTNAGTIAYAEAIREAAQRLR